jgi:hypothetical protein
LYFAFLKRKYREDHDEESYFDSDDDADNPEQQPPSHVAVDEVGAQEGHSELHRSPRVLSLSHAPILNNANSPQVQPNQVPQQQTMPGQYDGATTSQNDLPEGKIKI